MTDMPMQDVPPSPPAKKNPWKVIIPVAIVVILCCCLVVGGILAYMGFQGNGPLAFLQGLSGASDITGDWTIFWSWDCTGDYASGSISYFEDKTFNVDGDSSLWGTWSTSGKSVDFTFDEWPSTHYTGNVESATRMEGTMDNLDAMTGCWYAQK